MSKATINIMIVSDDHYYCRTIYRILVLKGVEVFLARKTSDGEFSVLSNDRDLILVDLCQDVERGLKVIANVRADESDVPILALLPVENVEARVTALELGADDCVPKQLDLRELLARMYAVVRRRRGHTRSLIEIGTVALDLLKREVTFGTKRTVLPQQEFALVRMLAEHPSRILSRDVLHDHLYRGEDDVSPTAVDVLIFYVRRKLGKDFIRNVRGRGWALSDVV